MKYGVAATFNFAEIALQIEHHERECKDKQEAQLSPRDRAMRRVS